MDEDRRWRQTRTAIRRRRTIVTDQKVAGWAAKEDNEDNEDENEGVARRGIGWWWMDERRRTPM